LHELNKAEQIVAGKRVKDKQKLEKLDLMQVTRLCFKHQVIKSSKLKVDIDKVREFRNRQHLGGLSAVERKYRRSDLEFCFNVIERTAKVASS